MAINRLKTWATDEVLTADDLNGEFNNVINFLNTYALLNPLTDDLDAGNNFILNAGFKKIWRVRSGDALGIQAAINDITSESDTEHQGGIVYLEPGEYTLSSSITLADDIWIIGAGWKTLIKKATSFLDDTNGELFTLSGADRCLFSSLRIDGQGQNNANGGNGIAAIRLMNGASDFMMTLVKVFNWGEITGSHNIVKQNDGFYCGQNEGGTEVGLSRNVRILNCHFSSVQRNGVSGVNGHGIWVENCWFADGGHAGLDIEANAGQICHDVYVKNNLVLRSAYRGLVVGAGAGGQGSHKNNLVIGNIVSTTDNAEGIIVDECDQAQIKDNVVKNIDDIGVRIWAIRDCEVSGNQIISCKSSAIWVNNDRGNSTQSTRDLRITGNYMSNCPRVSDGGNEHGVRINRGTGVMTNVSFSRNELRDCGKPSRAGVQFGKKIGGFVRVCDNSFYAANTNPSYGIYFEGTTVTDVMVAGNYTTGHSQKGFRWNVSSHLGDMEIGHNLFKEGTQGVS